MHEKKYLVSKANEHIHKDYKYWRSNFSCFPRFHFFEFCRFLCHQILMLILCHLIKQKWIYTHRSVYQISYNNFSLTFVKKVNCNIHWTAHFCFSSRLSLASITLIYFSALLCKRSSHCLLSLSARKVVSSWKTFTCTSQEIGLIILSKKILTLYSFLLYLLRILYMFPGLTSLESEPTLSGKTFPFFYNVP